MILLCGDGRNLMCVCLPLHVSQLFLRSLPEDCYLNIVGFGSRYNKLWPSSMKYGQGSLSQASAHVASKP